MRAERVAPASRGPERAPKDQGAATIAALFIALLLLLPAGGAGVLGFRKSESSEVAPTVAVTQTHVSTPQMKQAAAWAISVANSPNPTWSDHFDHPWSGYCEAFVSEAEGYLVGFDSALAAYKWQLAQGRIHTDSNPPAGALVYYKGGAYGHVAISIGNGQEVGTLGNAGEHLPVQQYAVRGFITAPFLGWANPVGS
jgi:hypothetical protein